MSPCSPIDLQMSIGGHFETESSMMMEILPRMNRALKTLGMTPLSAHCFYAQAEKPAHLLLEDLSTKGFRMADRRKGLDLDNCLLTMRRIAEFHASSVALKEKVDEMCKKDIVFQRLVPFLYD